MNGRRIAALGVKKACNVIGISNGLYYKWKQDPDCKDRRARELRKKVVVTRPNRHPDMALTEAELAQVIDHLKTPEYAHLSIRCMHSILLGQGIYVASASSYYRIAKKKGLTRAQRRKMYREAKTSIDIKRRTSHRVDGPNQVWMWDISYFEYAGTGRNVYLFLAEDLYSRKIVGARFYLSQTATEAVDFFNRVFYENGIKPEHHLKIHSDNGSAMRAEVTVNYFKSMGAELDTNRPRKSNDNPYVESLFGTLKGPYDFKVDHCRTIEYCNQELSKIVSMYNARPHSGIKSVPPAIRHQGSMDERKYLESCRMTHYEHFINNPKRYIQGKMRDYSPAGPVYLNADPQTVEQGLKEDPTNIALLKLANKMRKHNLL